MAGKPYGSLLKGEEVGLYFCVHPMERVLTGCSSWKLQSW